MSLQGSQKVAVLLCKFRDTERIEPNPAAFYRDLVARRRTGGVNDYWIAASLNSINLDGSRIFGWRTFDIDRADFLAANPGRADKIQAAMAQFSDVKFSDFPYVVALFNVDVTDGGAAGGILGGPTEANVTFLAHELGHLFGIEHSFDRSNRKAATWSAEGEYFDRHDIMSAMGVDSDFGHRFSPRGPLLNTANLIRMGWLPPQRVWRPPGLNSSGVHDIDIVALEHPELDGYLAVQAGGWIAEFRMPERFDQGLSQPAVLFHEYPANPNSFIIASDKSTHNHRWLPGQVHWHPLSFERFGGIRAMVVGFDLPAKKARLRVAVRAVRPPFVDPDTLFGLGIGQLPHDGMILVFRGGKIVPVPVPPSDPDPILPRLESLANRLVLDLIRERLA